MVTSETGLTFGGQQSRFQVDFVRWFIPACSPVMGWGRHILRLRLPVASQTLGLLIEFFTSILNSPLKYQNTTDNVPSSEGMQTPRRLELPA